MAAVLERSLTLVGPGRAGRAFLRSWTEAGGRAAQVIARSGAFDLAASPHGSSLRLATADRFEDTDLLVLAVPDDAIASCAEKLAGRLSSRFAFHLSGALEAQALAPLRAGGARVASLHPLRPFSGAPGEDWTGVFVAVEGDRGAAEEGERIARALGAHPHRLSAECKPLYHAAASLAAGGTVAVLSMAVRACVAAGVPEKLAREALASLANRAIAAAAKSSFGEALTGPVARRDVGTVRSHVSALAAEPETLALYRALADEVLSQTPGRGHEEEIRRSLAEGGSAERDPFSPRNPL